MFIDWLGFANNTFNIYKLLFVENKIFKMVHVTQEDTVPLSFISILSSEGDNPKFRSVDHLSSTVYRFARTVGISP